MTGQLFPESAEDAALAAESKPKRPQKGERRIQILQTLAAMLGEPGANRITVAALAERVGVQEAALYRHFKGKAEMFEALVEWINSSITELIKRIKERESDPRQQVRLVVMVLLQFGEKNPGMSCVLAGDGIVLEESRVKNKVNHFFEDVEARLRQTLYEAFSDSSTPTVEAKVRAAVLMAYVRGRLQAFVRSNYRSLPTEYMEPGLDILLA